MQNTDDEVSIFSLPSELLAIIFNKISLKDLGRTESTSKLWKKISWSSIRTFHTHIPNSALFAKALAKMNPLYLRKIKVKVRKSNTSQPTTDLRILEKFTKLQQIQLQDFSDEDIEIIIPVITYIKRLDLMLIDDTQFELISARLTNLTRLDLEVGLMEAMPGVTNLTRLNHLSLNFSKELTDSAAQNIFTMTNLTHLALFRCDKISGKCFQQVSQLKKLKFLDIGSSVCYEPEYFTALQKLPNLEGLEFWFFNEVTDEAFRLLGNIPHLTKLAIFVENDRVTARGLNNLSNLSRMVDLTIEYEKGAEILNDHFISHLLNLTRLEAQIREENISALTTLKSLQEFHVQTGLVTEDFFMNLAKLTALSSLNMDSVIMQLGFTALTALNHLTSLKFARCDVATHLGDDSFSFSTQLTNQLVTLTRLKTLHLSVDDCQNLSQLTNLEELSMARFQDTRKVKDLEIITTLPKLRRFRAELMSITELESLLRGKAPNVEFFERDE